MRFQLRGGARQNLGRKELGGSCWGKGDLKKKSWVLYSNLQGQDKFSPDSIKKDKRNERGERRKDQK